MNPNPYEHPTLLFRNSPIHGTGAFARVPVRVGTMVIEYTGEKISKEESRRRCAGDNRYIFFINEEFDLDGSADSNPARFINHSCNPNCDAEMIDGRIWVVARRDIATGEEVSFNYGYDQDDYKDHPCHCGASNCQGFIVAEQFHRPGGLKAKT